MDRFDSGGRRKESPECKICGEKTREGKEYCSDCIDKSSYVKTLLERLARMEEVDDIARKSRLSKKDKQAVSLSDNLDEVIKHLQAGPKTIEALVRDLHKDKQVVENYVKMLVSRGIAKTSRTKRGSTMVRLDSSLLSD